MGGENQMMSKALGASVVALLVASPALGQDRLRFFNNFDSAYQQLWQPVIQEFQQEHGVTIEGETIAGSGAAIYPDVLRTSMASGSPPDVFFMWGGTIAQPFIDAGQVREVTDHYEEFGWRERFPQWVVERLSQDDGTIYGVPFRARGMGLWYRKAVFEEHGLEEPESYEELVQICETLKEAGIHCASFGGQFGWHTMRLVDYFLEDTCGAETHDAINARQETWDQPCVVEAFERLQTWVENEWLVPDFLGVSPNDSRMAMYLGRAAMVYEGGWFENALKGDGQDPADYAFFLPPTPSGRYHAFPEQWMIPAAAMTPEVAGKFIDFITDPEVQMRHQQTFDGSPSIGYTPDCEVMPHACRWTEILTSDRGAYPPTDQAFEKELIDGFFEAQDAVVAGRMTPEEAARLIQRYVEQFDGT
jgi:raffinose/stachyose/melibiose transport system substrate-binding protein